MITDSLFSGKFTALFIPNHISYNSVRLSIQTAYARSNSLGFDPLGSSLLSAHFLAHQQQAISHNGALGELAKSNPFLPSMLLAQSLQHRNKLSTPSTNPASWYPWGSPTGQAAFSTSFIDAMAAASSAPASLQNQSLIKDSKDCKFPAQLHALERSLLTFHSLLFFFVL